MTYKLVLSILAVVTIVSGALCVLFPENMLANYDVQLSAMGIVIYRFWGSTLIGMGMCAWFARRTEDRNLRMGFVSSLLIATSLSTVMAIQGQYAGANENGWSIVGLYGLISLTLLGLLVRLLSTAQGEPGEK